MLLVSKNGIYILLEIAVCAKSEMCRNQSVVTCYLFNDMQLITDKRTCFLNTMHIYDSSYKLYKFYHKLPKMYNIIGHNCNILTHYCYPTFDHNNLI